MKRITFFSQAAAELEAIRVALNYESTQDMLLDAARTLRTLQRERHAGSKLLVVRPNGDQKELPLAGKGEKPCCPICDMEIETDEYSNLEQENRELRRVLEEVKLIDRTDKRLSIIEKALGQNEPVTIKALTGTWYARCEQCGTEYKDWCGSSPCCGSTTSVVKHITTEEEQHKGDAKLSEIAKRLRLKD